MQPQGQQGPSSSKPRTEDRTPGPRLGGCVCTGELLGVCKPIPRREAADARKRKRVYRVRKALDSLPPPKETTIDNKKLKKQRKTRRNVEGRKPAELTTLRVNFSKEVLRPCSLSGFRGKKKKVGRKIQKKKTLQLTCGFQTAAVAANEQKQQQNRAKKWEKRSSQHCRWLSGRDSKQKPARNRAASMAQLGERGVCF